MQFADTKLMGLLSLAGTVLGLVFGGMTILSDAAVGAAFFLLGAISFIVFALFLYRFVRYAQYEIPCENVFGDDDGK